jgi:DNA-binding response OmpR family regulator
MKAKILVVEDEAAMAEVIQDNLSYEGYEVSLAGTGEEACSKVFVFLPDLIILDILLPDKNGTEVCLYLRSRGIQIPILFLTAKGSELDRVLGLEIGGDDYLTKPFFMRELLARVKALLRRSQSHPAGDVIKIGEAVADLRRFTLVDGKGETHILSHYEAAILQLLLREVNKPVSRNEILNKIWGIEAYPTDRTVDNYIVKLRKKLEGDPQNPRHILTVHAVGYKLVL